MNVSTHVLDTSTGQPAAGVSCTLVNLGKATDTTKEPADAIAQAVTDADGRYRFSANLDNGTYRIRFQSGEYFAAKGIPTLYPYVDVVFSIDSSPLDHIHIPLLVSPFGYSTYRGS